MDSNKFIISASIVAVIAIALSAGTANATPYDSTVEDQARHTARLLGFSTSVTEACTDDFLSGTPTLWDACGKWVDIFEKHMTALLQEAGPQVQEILGFNPVPASSPNTDDNDITSILKEAQENAIAS